jgi:hypothetical protein
MSSYACFGDPKLQQYCPESCHYVDLHPSCNRGDRYVQGTLPENGFEH